MMSNPIVEVETGKHGAPGSQHQASYPQSAQRRPVAQPGSNGSGTELRDQFLPHQAEYGNDKRTPSL